MGQGMSISVRDYFNPLESPRNDRPSTFDPLAGFPKGRKQREMIATWEEMDEWKLSPGQRDYCAHRLIDVMRCQREWAPLAAHSCADIRHKYDLCEYEDYLLRMKEYERERRLLMRKRRKEKAAGISPETE
ncbi:unnamed protein product [Bursaphelenchus okinawaensis]|uniref:NADH dehydrogenase [ubiquinone] 1 beta subcomplex subunit 7 n=1 Tax=Bursaphelenchus okinawaensis TaxID=465554 RepID=A0A811JXN1_9BILA|nr:unnamed protein product [Bursaphelenchus okinawaensis]CAG9086607.1 unnamed protein product [Bursaphelenchus okinawaensis]